MLILKGRLMQLRLQITGLNSADKQCGEYNRNYPLAPIEYKEVIILKMMVLSCYLKKDR